MTKHNHMTPTIPNQNQNNGNSDELSQILANRTLRKELVRRSFLWFEIIYFSEYIKYPTADFQKEMMTLCEDDQVPLLNIIAMRACGKTSIIGQAYPIWSIISERKKLVVIFRKNLEMAKSHSDDLVREFEQNELLKNDLGPFRREDQNSGWRACSLYLPKYDAKIVVVSMEQAIRGIKFGHERPDVIILDDVEDIASVKTPEARKKLFQIFFGDINPMGQENTKVILTGNLLHEESLMSQIKEKINSGELAGIHREYALLDDNNNIIWPGKYPDMEAVEREKKRIGDRITWNREFLLLLTPDGQPIVDATWIKTYSKIPDRNYYNNYRYTVNGVDSAISEKSTADYTAIVTFDVFGSGEDLKIYVRANPFNAQVGWKDTKAVIVEMDNTMNSRKYNEFVIEDVGYQRVLADELRQTYNINAIRKPVHACKADRLRVVTHLIEDGKILFPEKGAEDLIKQLIYFGSLKHDDLVDAFSLGISHIMEQKNYSRKAGVLSAEYYATHKSYDDMTEDEKVEYRNKKAFENKMLVIKMNKEGYFLR